MSRLKFIRFNMEFNNFPLNNFKRFMPQKQNYIIYYEWVYFGIVPLMCITTFTFDYNI